MKSDFDEGLLTEQLGVLFILKMRHHGCMTNFSGLAVLVYF